MRFLLDTSLVSELVRPQPEKSVTDWVQNADEDRLFLSVLTLGELQKGIAKLPDSKRKERLATWADEEIPRRFEGRILEVTEAVAKAWGQLQGKAEKAGAKLPVVDSLIAATAQVYDLTVVTRNVSDMGRCGVEVHNPWDD